MSEMEKQPAAKLEHNRLDDVLAIPMFVVALVFLLVAGFLLHTGPGDIPESFEYATTLRRYCWIALAILYVCLIAETVAHHLAGSQNMGQHVRFLLLPFLRLCPRDHVDGSHAWVVGLGWRKTTPRFERYLSRVYSGPMIVIALMVLPVVGAEFFWSDAINENANWRFVIQTATGFIWMAFVLEFVLMVTVVEKKVRYCKQNWIDIVVIVLPLIAFLRAARLGRLMKLQQLSRTAKIYRMRGLALRSWRAVVTLDVIDTLMRRSSDYRIEKLQNLIAEKEVEIQLLKSELARHRETKQQRKSELAEMEQGDSESKKREMRFSYSRK